MTSKIKTMFKGNEPFATLNKVQYVKEKHESAFVFFAWYFPLVITLLTCLVLSILSLRLSYVTRETVRDLSEEVDSLKIIIGNSLINQNSELEREIYEKYLDHVHNPGLKESKVAYRKKASKVSTTTDAIGVVKYSKTDGTTTEDPKSLLVDILVSKYGNNKISRNADPSSQVKINVNHTDVAKIEQTTSSQSLESVQSENIQLQRGLEGKRIFKRSIKLQKRLMKLPQRIPDSVEEFPLGPEPTTPKHDNPLRRNKNRSRHNIETLDDRSNSGKKKSSPMIHFDGDSSGYIVGKHTNYNGNGHLSHPSQTYSDWLTPDWVKSLGMDEYFQVEKGLLKVKETGLYLLYVQIYYLDHHDTNGYRVYQNEETLAQCTTMTHSTERIFKGNTCYTSRLAYLKENDVISVRDLGNSRYTIFESGKSFFGLIKLK